MSDTQQYAEGLFIPDLDGPTFTSLKQLHEHLDQMAEIDAENGWLRAAEHNYFSPEEGGY